VLRASTFSDFDHSLTANGSLVPKLVIAMGRTYDQMPRGFPPRDGVSDRVMRVINRFANACRRFTWSRIQVSYFPRAAKRPPGSKRRRVSIYRDGVGPGGLIPLSRINTNFYSCMVAKKVQHHQRPPPRCTDLMRAIRPAFFRKAMRFSSRSMSSMMPCPVLQPLHTQLRNAPVS
jgi:hypothetical protein